jgi:hypothetical protein
VFFADLVVVPLRWSIEPHLAIWAPNCRAFGARATLAQGPCVIAAFTDFRELSACVYSQELAIHIFRQLNDELEACFNF